MKKSNELIKNTSIIFVGKFCTQFISFLLVPIYTNFLMTNDYGYIDLVQTYISLLVPIIILRFDSAVFRFLIDERKNENGKNKVISNTIFFSLIQMLLLSVVFIILNKWLNINYIIEIMINIIFMSLSSLLLQITRGIGDNIGYSIASIISAIVTIIFNIVFIIVFKMNGSSILIASGIANVVCSIYLIFRNKIYKYIKLEYIDKLKFKEMTKYSLPMIPDGLSWWVVNVSDRTIITFIIGASENGIYAVSSKFSNILSSVFQIFNMSWQESASMHIDDEDNIIFFNKVLNIGYKVFFSICTLILVCMPFIFKYIIGNNYREASLYIPILLLGNLYNAISNIIGGVYIAKKNTKLVARTTILAAIINIIINIIMINKFGLYAAAISTLISYVILTIYRYINVKKYMDLKLDKKMLFKTTCFYILSTIIYYCNNLIGDIFNLLIVCTVCIKINWNEIVKILTKIGGKNEKNFNIWNF